MTRRRETLHRATAWLAGLLLVAGVSVAQEEAPPIEDEVAHLQGLLRAAHEAPSKTRQRRAYKGVVREAEALLDASPTAPGRFRVLEVVLQSQKRLLLIDNSERNREALFATCERLVEAPDELALLRLEADLLLAERDLSGRNADVEERAAALAALVARYRDTPGEAKSLMLAARIAPKLEAFDLEREIGRTLDERFPGDLDVIEWRRAHRDFSHLPVLFAGEYTRADGETLAFPVDRMGHTSLIYFWSRETPEIEAHLDELEDLRARFPHHFEVFSLNLDELPDAGEAYLRARGLDWTALLLPGGRESQVYRAYAASDPLAIRVNAHGHAHVSSTETRAFSAETPMEQNLDDPRYLAQLQSLLVGDFLVAAGSGEHAQGAVPAETLAAIQACFVPAPLRYRLTPAEALAHYERAAALCREARARHPGAPDLWRVENRLIVALLGMWSVATEPAFLRAATEEARALLTRSLPRGADLAPRFCLAKAALRAGAADARGVVSELVEACGGDDAPAPALAAAAVLALDAGTRDLHVACRDRLLELPAEDPALWPVRTFLDDQNHRYRLFEPNFYYPPSLARRVERGRLRGNAVALDRAPDFTGPLAAELEALDGETLRLPRATAGELTLLLFVEPPADATAGFPMAINGSIREDDRGRVIETQGLMQKAFELADLHLGDGLQVIAVFLDEDRARVRALMEEHRWPCRVALLPGGLANPLVRRLGILSADRVPNPVLLHPDGTVAWRLSGIVHPQLRSEGVGELVHVIARAIRTHVQAFAMEASLSAFERGELEEAARLFSGPFAAPERPSFDEWTAPRLHGRALTHVRLENWEAALADVDAAIEAHQAVFNARKPCMCARVAGLRLVRATVLDELGRAQEAREARRDAQDVKRTHGASRAGRLHDRLESLCEDGPR